MAGVVRFGDATSHGGKVIDCRFADFKAGSRPMAVVGDKVSCPIPGHVNCTIATGHARHKIKGVAVAYDGDATSCGATLMSSKPDFSLK